MFEVEILQAIVEQKGIDLPVIDRITPAFDAIFINEDDYVLQIVGEHVRFVPRGQRIQMQPFSVGHDAWRINDSAEKPVQPAVLGRFRLTFITAAKNRDPTTANL